MYTHTHTHTHTHTYFLSKQRRKDYLNSNLVTMCCDWQQKEGVDGRILSATDNSCLLHSPERQRQKARDRQRERERDTHTHTHTPKQMHSNAPLHIFPIKVVACVIPKLRNANEKKVDDRVHHVNFHHHKPSIGAWHYSVAQMTNRDAKSHTHTHTHTHTDLLNIHWSEDGVMNGSQQWIMDHILMVDLPLSLLGC